MSEGTVFRRGDTGQWVARWTDNQGRRRYRYRGTRTEARQALRDGLRARDEGAGGDDPTLQAWAAWWLDQLDQRPTTIADRRYKIGLLPGWLTRKRLSKVTPMDVHEALREIAGQTTIHGRPRAASTVAQTRTVLTQCLRAAERYGHVTRNVAALAAPVPYQHATPDPLELDQARRLLAQVEGHPLASMYTVAFGTGMRLGELLGLRWPHVDLDNGTIRVEIQRTRTASGEHVEGAPKTASSRRTVGLPGFVVEALAGHRTANRGTVVPLDGYVWTTQAGTPYLASNIRRHLRHACRAAGLEPVTFHTLRHSHATLLLALGVSPVAIADALGHSDLRQLRRYAHVEAELRKTTAEVFEAGFRGAEGVF
jgi:integrase